MKTFLRIVELLIGLLLVISAIRHLFHKDEPKAEEPKRVTNNIVIEEQTTKNVVIEKPQDTRDAFDQARDAFTRLKKTLGEVL